MSEINVGDKCRRHVGNMSVTCRKEKQLKANMLSFCGKLVTDNKCRKHVGNLVGDFKNGEKIWR